MSNVPIANEIKVEISAFCTFSANNTKPAAVNIAPILPKILKRIIHPRMAFSPQFYD
ncbi:MAG: hypothetical protein ACFE96_08670 [Candidatus Hermodarchaeota archaeon]